MSAHPPAHVSDPEGLAIHRLLLERDPGAFEALFYRYFEALKRRAFEKLHESSDREDVAHNLVVDALIKLFNEPERYQPEKGKSLWGYLWMDVEGDVRNHNEKLRRQPKIVQFSALNRDDDDAVGEQDFGGNIASDDPTPEEAFLDEEDRQVIREHAALIRENVVKTPEEAIVFDLQYVHGVKATAIFAEQLGIAHRSESEQAADVQRIKDRLDKRIKRLLKDRT